MTKNRVVLKDIAEKSGYTMNTVSRALHNQTVISKAARDKIQKIAKEMGYVPDAIATGLRSGQSKTIGIMFDHLLNPYYMIMTDVIHEFVKEVGYDVMIFTSTNRNIHFMQDGFEKMVSRRIDGIISFIKPTQEVVRLIESTGIPTIVMGRNCEDIGLHYINTDDFEGGLIMGSHLIESGYERIAYIGGPKEIDCSINRYRGLKSAIESSGQSFDENLVRFTDNSLHSLETDLKHMISQKVDIILCYNDYMALEAMYLLNKLGYSIPEDVAIAGYDDIQETLKMPTKLTTIGANKQQYVKRVVDALFEKIGNGSDVLDQETLPVHLVKGVTA